MFQLTDIAFRGPERQVVDIDIVMVTPHYTIVVWLQKHRIIL
jgi:hypothetical protein